MEKKNHNIPDEWDKICTALVLCEQAYSTSQAIMDDPTGQAGNGQYDYFSASLGKVIHDLMSDAKDILGELLDAHSELKREMA